MTSRGVWVYRNGKAIPKHLAPPLHPKHAEGFMLIRDTMEPTWNPANGRKYDSKRAYEKAVRAAGCTIVGNEKQKQIGPAQRVCTEQDVVNAMNQVASRQPAQRRKKSGQSRAGG